MTCKQCGFAAADAAVTVCPFCKTGAGGTATIALASAVWPPAPTTSSQVGYSSAQSTQTLRQAGILMAIIPLVVIHVVSYFRNFLPMPYGELAMVIVVIACIYLHFRGCADWAESKGYPRFEGRLLGIIGWLGVLFLAIRRDKTLVLA